MGACYRTSGKTPEHSWMTLTCFALYGKHSDYNGKEKNKPTKNPLDGSPLENLTS